MVKHTKIMMSFLNSWVYNGHDFGGADNFSFTLIVDPKQRAHLVDSRKNSPRYSLAVLLPYLPVLFTTPCFVSSFSPD
jgi:hypothetical protein